MSGKLDTIDPAEIQKFKARFAAGRAKQIEDANTEAVRLKGQAETDQETVTALEKETATNLKNWKDKERLRLKKKNPGQPTDPELERKALYEASDAKLDTAKQTLATTVKDRDAALKLADRLPREGYEEKFKALIARLKGTGVEMATLDATAVADIKAMLIARDYDGVDARLLAIENMVLDTVAARDLPTKHAALGARLSILDTQSAKSPKALGALKTTLASVGIDPPTGAALARLERELEPEIADLERKVQAVLDLIQPLDGAIKTLERTGTDAADHRIELNKCVNIAKANLDGATVRLTDLDKAVKATQQNRQDQAAAALEYPSELAEFEQRIADFPNLSLSHKSRGGALAQKTSNLLKSAKSSATAGDFVTARDLIAQADGEVDTLDEAANDQEDEKAAKLNAQQALLAKQAKDAAAKLAKDAADQAAAAAAALALAQFNAARNALTVASLDLIGKDSTDFEDWMDKVRALRTANLLTVTAATGTYWLNGRSTVEIEIDIKGVVDQGFTDYFVVHYHPTVVYDGTGSQVHAKPYTGNMTTPKDRRMNQTNYWLFGTVPSLANVDANLPA